MFYLLSKIAGIFLSPLNIIFLLLVFGGIFILLKAKIGRSLLICGMFLFIAFGFFPVGHNALVYLENIYERPQELPDDVDGILVLGGSSVSAIADKRGAIALNDSVERILEALVLGQKYPEAIIGFSGGNGRIFSEDDRTEADDVEMLLQEIGYPMDNVFYEDQSRTTFENIAFSRVLFLPHHEETWILVTSAYHMPRAMAVAQRLNWINFIPYPTDFRTTGKMDWVPHKLDVLGNMYDTSVAMHEYAGLVGYQLAGKISLPLH